MNPHHGQSGYPHQQSNMDMYPQEGEMDEDMSDSGSGSSSHGKTSQAGPSKRKGPRKPRQPLRRGDACLMCRAKKLKCSATKPACDQCTKRKDRCVYDAIRPASRVEKLEKKLAEIEELETQSSSGARRHSELPNPQYRPYPHEQPLPLRPLLSSSMDSGLYSYNPPYTTTTANYDRAESASSLGTPVLGPGTIDAWSFNDPFAATTIQPQPNQAVQLDALPWPVLSTSNNVSTIWGSTPFMDFNGAGLNDESLNYSMGTGAEFNFDNLNTDPAQLAFPPPAYMASNSNAGPYPPNLVPGTPASADAVIDDVLAHATTYTGIKLQESDISQSARDYLLDLFFAPPRSRAGSEPWSEAQFRSRMSLPLRQRAHPGLLFAMYTSAASSSYIPAVRALADSLYMIAAQKVDEGIAQEDRLLDCINACKVLGKWLFQKARALEGYNMTWKGVSLVHACQLDKITTNIWSPEMLKRKRTPENPWPLLGPPKDQWDLGQRIHAFWGTYGNVRGASIMLPWPTPIQDETVLTPLPHSPDAYLDGSVQHLPDISLRDLYEMPHSGSRPYGYIYGLMLASVHLLQRAKTIRTDRLESQTTYRALATKQAPAVRSPRLDNPAAYTEIMDAASHLLATLPMDARVDMFSPVPWTDSDVPMILVCLIGVRLHLHDPEGDTFDRETCIAAAREAASLIKVWIRQLKSITDESKQSARYADGNGAGTPNLNSRHKLGTAGPYVLVPWFWTANRLIRSARMLRKLGREAEAAELEGDAAVVVHGLKDQGVLYPMPMTGDSS